MPSFECRVLYYFHINLNVIHIINFSSKCILMEGDTSEFSIWVIFLTIILPSVGGFGILSYTCWLVYEYFRQNYVVSFTINTMQPSYDWIILWLQVFKFGNGNIHWIIICSDYNYNKFRYVQRISFWETPV